MIEPLRRLLSEYRSVLAKVEEDSKNKKEKVWSLSLYVTVAPHDIAKYVCNF